MSELIGWLIVLGLALTIACLFMLSHQLEKHLRSTIEIIARSNEMILARLERMAEGQPQAREPVLGVIIERRRCQRRSAASRLSSEGAERRTSRGRRLEDLLSV